MVADFVKYTEYVTLCGSRTVLDVVSTLISIFDRHDPGSYEAKTVGRVVDLPTIRKEISSLQTVLEDSRKLSNYFRMTALFLQERESAAKKHMKRLKRQEKEQERLRAAFKAFIREPAIPKEITNTVLHYLSTNNRIRREGGPTVHVDGLIPLAVYDPYLLLPHYQEDFSAEWTLEDIAKQELKITVLEDAALINHIKLRVTAIFDPSSLRPLMEYPHQWKKLVLCSGSILDMNDFIYVFKLCLPHLEDLVVRSMPLTSSWDVLKLPFNSYPRLKSADLSFNTLSILFNYGILDSITSLTLSGIKEKNEFPNHDAFKKALNDLPLVLSRLSCLREFIVEFISYDQTDMEGLQRVHSTSLRSLQLSPVNNVTAIAFLDLFVDCPIDCLNVYADVLEEAERLFGKARHIVCWGYVPDILSERKRDGSLAFPRMDQMELLLPRNPSENKLLEFQNRLLGCVRMRYDDRVVCKVGHLRVPRELVSDRQFQDELERYIPSLVLF